ncbi:MAG: SDR family NAD(P)-dependent oxidoreductase [Chitinophagaceae bacterium]|nr:SDR family NAD(P)-dependent oxidoreductase [Chitinophagaceae bacterium]
MTNRHVIIIGASSGIGRKMAEQYLEKGYRVGITGRRMELLEEIKNQYPASVELACYDVRNGNNDQELEELVHRLGGLDTLVISAGTGEPSSDLEWRIDKETVDTNVTGFIQAANWAYRYFASKKEGRLAIISSVAANRGGLHAPVYNASKAFQSSYAYGLALKAGRISQDFSVTCIEPGFVATKMAKSDKLFWVVPVDKAARQIIQAIEKRRRKAYISHRWRLVAFVLRHIPHWLYKRVG